MPKPPVDQLLTAKQQRFVKEYLVDMNATQAAARAGYSARTARAIGRENLQKPQVKAAIDAAKQKLLNKLELNAEKVLGNIERLAGKAEGDGRFADALRGWELLGKHLKLFTEKHEHGGIGGGAISLNISENDEKL